MSLPTTARRTPRPSLRTAVLAFALIELAIISTALYLGYVR